LEIPRAGGLVALEWTTEMLLIMAVEYPPKAPFGRKSFHFLLSMPIINMVE
jgi:hypothetical protein